MEVLVALLLVAVGVLGFIALQLRSMDAVNEAADRTFAINIARDLAERMRINKTAFEQYKESINDNKKDGSGVGLSIAQEIINLHKGKIKIDKSDNILSFKITF